MAKNKPVALNVYDDLIIAIKSALIGGFVAAKKALEYQRLKTYWEVGKEITERVAASNGQMVLGPKLYKKISLDIQKNTGLELSRDTISRAVQFNKNYPEFPTDTSLTFTHYRKLQHVKDLGLRARVEKKAITSSMSTASLANEITRLKVKQNKVHNGVIERLDIRRGEPFVYIVRSARDINGKKEFIIDCGFKISVLVKASGHKIKCDLSKSNVNIVRVEKKDNIYNIFTMRSGSDKVYTYSAKVVRVIDGDTIDVRIDVGFGIWLDERLRLNSINTPEVTTDLGKLSKQFLEKYFSKCPNIIIRTSKEGMYGRWLADIFALKDCSDPYKIAVQGEYLNQVLLDEGLASIYKP